MQFSAILSLNIVSYFLSKSSPLNISIFIWMCFLSYHLFLIVVPLILVYISSPWNASFRTNWWTIDQLRSRHTVREKEFVAKPSEKKMMMKRKMRRLEAKPEHESRSIQRVSSRCKWTNNYQYLMYKFILAICNQIRCFENSTCIENMLILNDEFFLHVLSLRYYLTFDCLYWLSIIDFESNL